MTLEREQRERRMVVTEALSWLGTPYHLNAKVKGAGVDCGTFLTSCFANVGLIEEVELGHFKPDFHLHRGIEVYAGWLRKYCRPVHGACPMPGDILLYRFGRILSHGALVIEWPQIIHAYVDIGVVLADAERDEIATRQEAVFSFWRGQA